MAGPEILGGATLIKVGMSLIERVVPRGIGVVRSWLKGKTIAVVGPARAGKTTFIDYLQYGLFEDEKETVKTSRTNPSARFDVKVGRESALELNVKSAIDVPGQVGAVEHANVVFQHRPQAIVLLLDPTHKNGEDSADQWLSHFCRHLETLWRAKGPRGNRTRIMVVVLSKRDKVDSHTIEACRSKLKAILEERLASARGKMVEEIMVYPCCLVSNPNGPKDVDAVIAHVAKSLARKI